jgi:hypothetical protein
MAANAVAIVSPTYGDAYGGPDWDAYQFPISNAVIDTNQLTIGGQAEGSDGIARTPLPDGAVIYPPVIDPSVPMFAYYLTDTKDPKPIISANGIPLDPNTVNPNASFCVGQYVTFTNSALPANMVILSNEWSFTGTFYNNYFATGFPTNSESNSLETNFLKTATTSAWWISGGDPANTNPNIPSQYQATCTITLMFNDGTISSLTTTGRFNMFRPVVTVSVLTGTLQVITNGDDSRDLSCGDGTNHPGISIFNTINYSSNFPGQCYWEQLFTSTSRTLTDANTNVYTLQQNNPGPWLDDGEAKNNSRNVYPFFNTNHFHSIATVDSPDLPLPEDFMRAHTDESLQMTMMFRLNDSSFDVPLITIPWTWVGNAVFNPYFPYGWQGSGQISTNAINVNPGYPIWNSLWTDHQFNPPLP